MRIAVFSACLFLLTATVYAGNETHFYGPQGHYQGRATTNTANPRQKSVYDNHGNYVGRIMTDDKGNSRVYDNHGKYQGRTTGWSQPKTSKR